MVWRASLDEHSREGDELMRPSRRVALSGAVLVFLLGMAGTSKAQTATGQITGTVKDASGAVIPQVKVIAEDVRKIVEI